MHRPIFKSICTILHRTAAHFLPVRQSGGGFPFFIFEIFTGYKYQSHEHENVHLILTPSNSLLKFGDCGRIEGHASYSGVFNITLHSVGLFNFICVLFSNIFWLKVKNLYCNYLILLLYHTFFSLSIIYIEREMAGKALLL